MSKGEVNKPTYLEDRELTISFRNDYTEKEKKEYMDQLCMRDDWQDAGVLIVQKDCTSDDITILKGDITIE